MIQRLLKQHGPFIGVWVALTCLVLVPVWSQRLLPMLDTPAHLALVRGWHSFADPSYRLAEYYELRIRVSAEGQEVARSAFFTLQ